MIEVKKLNISYQSNDGIIQLLNQISFKVGKGEILGVTGPSGSGKTMLAKSIMGLNSGLKNLTITGEILFEEINLLKQSEMKWCRIRGKRISMIFQEPEAVLNPLIRCGKQVMEAILQHNPTWNKNDVKVKVLELLSKVELDEPARAFNAFPHELSGGQLQRIVIAIAIANNPDILIADEATSSLDAVTSKKIISLLCRLQKENKSTLIFITHDIRLLISISENILIMQNGTIADHFSYQEMATGQISDFAREYLEMAKFKNRIKTEPGSQGTVLLEIQNLNKSFYSASFFNFWNKIAKTALTDVNFALKAGCMLGIVGESGSGKTTLGKIITGVVEATSGNIIYKGEKISDRNLASDRNLRKNIQLIFQDSYTSLDPLYTVGQTLLEVISFYRLADSKTEKEGVLNKILFDLDLDTSLKDRFIYQLSGGQRQRVAIARTLLIKPELIVFDESLSSLDVYNQIKIMDMILNLQRQYQFTGIFITHDVDLVQYLCSEAIIMENGKIIKSGKVSDLLFLQE